MQRPANNMRPQTVTDCFFLAAVQAVCKPYGYELGREIVLGPDRQICINDPDITEDQCRELAIALEEAVGHVSE